MINIKDIAECLNGFTFREKPHTHSAGDIPIIQVGNIALDGSLDTAAAIRTLYKPVYDKFMVHEGDIIFRGRAGYAAALVQGFSTPMIVASPLIIIRPDRTRAYPEYIAWFLNSPFAARYFSRSGQGSILKAIGITELAQLNIPLPQLSKQELILKAAVLLNQEQKLLQGISILKERLVTSSLLQTAKQYDQS